MIAWKQQGPFKCCGVCFFPLILALYVEISEEIKSLQVGGDKSAANGIINLFGIIDLDVNILTLQ